MSKESMPGIGAMLHALGDNRASVEAWRSIIGQPIAAISLGVDDDVLRITAADGARVKVWDNGQSCCESRYMRTDDELSQFVGATLTNAELREAPDVEAGGEAHEVQFLVLVTDRGNITFSNHNEHNGYYGGFGIEAAKD